MTTETAPIDPLALRFNREQARISQRELGRRVGKRLGYPEASIRALQVRLHRIEKGDELSEEERDLVDAVAAELAVGAGDLAEPPVWAYIRLDGDRPGIVELAMRMPFWSTPEAAYAARDWLAHASDGVLTPFKGAQLVPFRVLTVGDILDANYPNLTDSERSTLIALDLNSEEQLGYLAALNLYLNDDDLPFEAALAALGEKALPKSFSFGELEQLHELAMRRLINAPRDEPRLVAAWRRREQRLHGLLEDTWKIRQQWRDEMIAIAPEV